MKRHVLVGAALGVVILQRRKQMADPEAGEKTEEKVKETGSPKQDSELSESDFEKVSGRIGSCPSISFR